ncbi:MAG: helix-turn-helix transcriptional regulator [Lachnospiraceae bacterium]|nr:helix-turn-helix transcriptional regulator [Lachnospiraceae bacterium]
MEERKSNFNHTDKYIEIGYNIAYYRKHAKLTQEQLAEMLGISRSHISAIEAPNIVRKISMDLLFDIAAVLDVEVYKLLLFKH